MQWNKTTQGITYGLGGLAIILLGYISYKNVNNQNVENKEENQYINDDPTENIAFQTKQTRKALSDLERDELDDAYLKTGGRRKTNKKHKKSRKSRKHKK